MVFLKNNIRFTSNKKTFDSFKNNKKFFKKPSIYKICFSKSIAFDNLKNKLNEKYITLLDFEPDYKEMVDSTGKLNQADIDKHYSNSIIFLKKISKTFNKEGYNLYSSNYDLKKFQKFIMNLM